MHVVDLATSETPWWGPPVAVLLFASTPCLIALVFLVSRMFRSPKFRGPALTGTAQVLSLKRIGSMMVNSLVPQVMCRIALRVDVPGRQPYEVKRAGSRIESGERI